MCSLPRVSGRDAVRAFERAGFSVVRVRGSHHVMKREGHPFLVVVPVHGNKTLATGTLRALVDGAGLTAEQFAALL
jgi:predicted RNA binding protein YcfA (HicA-like mRNA interferase family)